MTGALSVLERTAPENSEVTVFSAVFVIVALGSIFVTLNAKVLGGQCSVFQSVCVLGYCLFPLVLDAIILEIIRIVAFHSFLLQLLLSVGAFLWSTFCMHPHGFGVVVAPLTPPSPSLTRFHGRAGAAVAEMARHLSPFPILLCAHLADHHPSAGQVSVLQIYQTIHYTHTHRLTTPVTPTTR